MLSITFFNPISKSFHHSLNVNYQVIFNIDPNNISSIQLYHIFYQSHHIIHQSYQITSSFNHINLSLYLSITQSSYHLILQACHPTDSTTRLSLALIY